MTNNFTNSEAWRLKIPKGNQRVLPFTWRPTPGINTITSKAAPAINSTTPPFSQYMRRARITTAAAANPSPTYSNCRTE